MNESVLNTLAEVAILARSEAEALWWLGAVAITIAEPSVTFSYFIPTMIRLMSTEYLPESEVKPHPVAMEASELRSSCSNSGVVVGSAEGVVVAN